MWVKNIIRQFTMNLSKEKKKVKKRADELISFPLCRVTFYIFYYTHVISFGAPYIIKEISEDNDDESWAQIHHTLSASAGKISLWWMKEALFDFFAAKKLIAFLMCLLLFNFLKLELTHINPPTFSLKFLQNNLIILLSSLELIV